MTYFASRSAAQEGAASRLAEVCLSCGTSVDGPIVVYDGFNGTSGRSFIFHRSCALEVANRLIIDAWQHRHAHPQVTLDE